MSETTYDRSTQDVGNLLGLEHVNLQVADRDLADRFWASAMGFTRDAYVDLGLYANMWVNLGGQQMHLPMGEPQCFRGRIGLSVPDVDLVEKRVGRLVESFNPAAEAGVASRRADGALHVTAPWGTELVVHEVGDVPWFGGIGMPYVEIDVEPGCAAGAAAFYRDIFEAPAGVVEHGGRTLAEVSVGRRQQLRLVETDRPLAAYDGHHIAVYLHNFSRPYERLLERGLITRESDEHEYRFTDIVDPTTGAVCAVIEHEVRSMFHPMFGRELVNRDVRQGLGSRYRQGHDVQAGLHHSGVG